MRVYVTAFVAVAGGLPQPPEQEPSSLSGEKSTVSQNREIREKEEAVSVSTSVNHCQPVSTGDNRWEQGAEFLLRFD